MGACRRTVLVAAAFAVVCFGARAADYMIGADLSFLKHAEEQGTVFRDSWQARPRDLSGPRIQLDPPAAVPHPETVAQQPRVHDRAGQRGPEARLQVPARLTLRRFMGRPRQAAHPESLGGQVALQLSATRACCRTWCRSDEATNGILWPDGNCRRTGITSRS